MPNLLLWLLKALALYAFSFLGWCLLYYALFQSIVPPQHLSRPLQLIPNPKGQLSASISFANERDDAQSNAIMSQFSFLQKSKKSSSSSSSSSSSIWKSGLKYDISLWLKYADRPEVADLGGILFTAHFDTEPEPRLSTWQALRYEVPLHRTCRHLLELPMALWRGEGSVAEERIFLAQDLELSAGSGPDRLLITLDSLKVPLHGCTLQINGHLTGLAYVLYYWRIAGAVIVIGGGTIGTWILISLGLIVEFVLQMKRVRGSVKARDGEESESESIDTEPLELQEFTGLIEARDQEELEEAEEIVLKDKDELNEGLRRRLPIEPITEEDDSSEDDHSVPNTP